MSSAESQELLLAIDNIVKKHSDSFKQQVNDRFNKIEEQIKVIPQMQSTIEVMQNTIEVMQNTIEVMQNTIEVMQNTIEVMQKDIKELYKEVRNISRTVAKIEYEHGEKLAIIFDAVTSNIETQEILKKRLDKCEKRIEHNNDKIYYLNSKIENL